MLLFLWFFTVVVRMSGIDNERLPLLVIQSIHLNNSIKTHCKSSCHLTLCCFPCVNGRDLIMVENVNDKLNVKL